MKSILFVLVFLFSSLVLMSQGEVPCYPDCPTYIWQPVYPAPPWFCDVILPNCPNDVIRVYYRHRTACAQQYNDIYIEKIEFIGDPDNDLNYLECVNAYGGLAGYIAAATAAMFTAPPGSYCNFILRPTGIGECQTNWRVMKGACWKLDISKRMIEPCENSNIICCLEAWMVCMKPDGTLSAGQFGLLVEGVCAEYSVCTPVCGSVYSR